MKYQINQNDKMFDIFCDGTKVYKEFAREYKRHKKGLFILAPSGAGKTHFVKNQKEKHWIDGDNLWMATGAHPADDWWNQGLKVINRVDRRSDVITEQAVNLGFWIMGASNFWYAPDAIVIPDLRIQKKYIKKREEGNYDGGAKSDDLPQVLTHRKFLRDFARKHKVKTFKSIEAAVEYLTAGIGK